MAHSEDERPGVIPHSCVSPLGQKRQSDHRFQVQSRESTRGKYPHIVEFMFMDASVISSNTCQMQQAIRILCQHLLNLQIKIHLSIEDCLFLDLNLQSIITCKQYFVAYMSTHIAQYLKEGINLLLYTVLWMLCSGWLATYPFYLFFQHFYVIDNLNFSHQSQ